MQDTICQEASDDAAKVCRHPEASQANWQFILGIEVWETSACENITDGETDKTCIELEQV